MVTEHIGAKEHRKNRSKSTREKSSQPDQTGPKLSRREKRIRKRIQEYGFLNMRYQKKYKDFFVYSDTPFVIEKLHDKEAGGEYETETMVIQNPVTKKSLNYIERERIARTKETGYGARSKVYLIQTKDAEGRDRGQVTITEFDRNLNVLGESIVSEYNESYNNTELNESMQDMAREKAKKEQYGVRLVLLEADVNNPKLSSKKLAGMYKQQDIRSLADLVGVTPEPSDEKTINKIRRHLEEEREKNRTRTHRVKSKSSLEYNRDNWATISKAEDTYQQYRRSDGKPKTFTEMEYQEERRVKEMEKLLS